MYWKVAWYTVSIYINGNYISIYGLLSIRTSILDYLRESFPWPARPFKHTESNSFKHTATTFKYMNSYFILPPGPRGLARPPHIQMLLPYIYIYIHSCLLAKPHPPSPHGMASMSFHFWFPRLCPLLYAKRTVFQCGPSLEHLLRIERTICRKSCTWMVNQ